MEMMSGAVSMLLRAQRLRRCCIAPTRFLGHKLQALIELVADDCVIENTQPAPGGARRAKEACVALWTQMTTAPGIHFKPESIVARGDRGDIKWPLVWGPEHMDSGRGVNLMRVRD